MKWNGFKSKRIELNRTKLILIHKTKLNRIRINKKIFLFNQIKNNNKKLTNIFLTFINNNKNNFNNMVDKKFFKMYLNLQKELT
jgi:hypothetical protein